jgi:hypothetical protein
MGIFPCAGTCATECCRDLPAYTTCARRASCSKRYNPRAQQSEHHRFIRQACWARRWRVPRHRAVERRADRAATLRRRKPAAGHRERANCRIRPCRIPRHGGTKHEGDTILLAHSVSGRKNSRALKRVVPQPPALTTAVFSGLVGGANAAQAVKNAAGQ